MIVQAFQVAVTRIYQRHTPERNPAYLRFLRRFPCIVCGSWRGVEAAHFGPHGIGQKASDLDALPVCSRCHRTSNDSYHRLGPVKFALIHNLDVPALIQMFRRFWEQRHHRSEI